MAPVKPIESFGASSQRAMEEFRLNYNTSLASQPKVWAEELGDLLMGPSLKDDYPIAFDVQKWRELTGVNADAITTLVKDIQVVKRKFGTAAKVELDRLKRGDHAYVLSWARKPASMARGRIFLRNHLVVDLLLTGQTAGTCVLDGQAFFSATHPINPFDSGIKDKAGNTTWSNLQASATPLNSANLTAEKTLFKQTPGPDGEELGLEATHVLVPTCLDDTAYNLLSVQDLILSGALDGAGGGTMGTVRNPHFGSGLKKVRAPELPGTDGTADWYLLSETAIAMGMFPWVISEDDLPPKEWGEDSDYFKSSDNIKIEQRALLEAAFLFPHGIRKIKGA